MGQTLCRRWPGGEEIAGAAVTSDRSLSSIIFEHLDYDETAYGRGFLSSRLVCRDEMHEKLYEHMPV